MTEDDDQHRECEGSADRCSITSRSRSTEMSAIPSNGVRDDASGCTDSTKAVTTPCSLFISLQPERIIYVHSDELIAGADLLPANLGRASRVHDLVAHLPGLLSRVKVVAPVPATEQELRRYHSDELVARLLDAEAYSEDERPRKRRREDGDVLNSDCPPFPRMADYVRLVAGASLTAARALRDREARVAISWTGGRHHASKEKATGFCYVNDIVLAIGELRKASTIVPRPKRLDRVLYLDLDLHAGDGVHGAFWSSPNVLTLSAHYHSPGFFPASHPLELTGPLSPSPAHLHSLNIAIPQNGCSDATLERLFDSCVVPVREAFAPDALVLQLGVDALAGDPNNEFNYSSTGLLRILAFCLAWNLPTLLLGGGGYHSPNAARAWTACTALTAGLHTPEEMADVPIPETARYWTEYGPSYLLEVPAGQRADLNTETDLLRIERAFEGYVAGLRERYERDA